MQRAIQLSTLTLCLTLAAGHAVAQLPQARLYALHPAGAQAGQSVSVTVSAGEDLDEGRVLLFSHPGITCEPLADPPASAVGAAFKVNVAADVPPGLYEATCSGRFGVSNPRRFHVGQRPVTVESEGNNNVAEADELPLNSCLYGQINGTADVDWYRVSLKSGQSVTCECLSETLDSRLTALVSIHDQAGRKRFASERGLPGRDPMIPFVAPADGEYLIRIHDATYRGGAEFGYSLTVHTAPQVEFALPHAVIAGSTTTVTLYGYNLPGGVNVTVAPPTKPTQPVLQKLDVEIAAPAESVLAVDAKLSPAEAALDAFTWRLPSDQGPSNPVRLGITTAQLQVEANSPENAPQTVSLPVDVSGQFSMIGDEDRYRFTAKKGEVIWIEALGQRLGTTVDPVLIVQRVQTDAEGKETISQIAVEDDQASNPLQNVFEIATSDPAYRLQVPEDGLYQVTLRDRYWESRGEAAMAYRCRLGFERPDFRLVAVPASPTPGQTWPIGLRQGDNVAINVLAFRKDGYAGPIDLSVEGLPEGVTCSGGRIGEGQANSVITLNVGSSAASGWHNVSIIGTASIEDSQAIAASAEADKALIQAQQPVAELKAKSAAISEKLAMLQSAVSNASTVVAGAGDEALKTELEQAGSQLVASLTKAQEQTTAAVTAAEQALAAAQATADAARQRATAARRDLRQAARVGTILWSAANNVPAISRVSTQLGLSIMHEQAPLQLHTNVKRIHVRPGRQVLLGTNIERRGGFDEVVKFDVQGLPKDANIDIEKGEFAKGQAERIVRFFVKENAPVSRTFTAWLSTEAEVNFARNPERAARFLQAFEQAKVTHAASQASVDAAVKAKTDAEAALKALQQSLQAATTDRDQKAATYTALQMELEQIAAALAKSTDASVKASALAEASKLVQAQLDKAGVEATASATAAANAFEAASQLLATAPENANLKQRVEAAQKTKVMLTKLVEELKVQSGAVAAEAMLADKQVQVSSEQIKLYTTQQAEKMAVAAAAKSALDQAVALLEKTTAEEAAAKEQFAKAEAAEKQARDILAQTDAALKAAEKNSADAAKASEAKKLKFTPPSEPVVFIIDPAPVAVKANVPGPVKPGEKIEVKVTIERKEGFAGPVRVGLGDVPGGAGLTAEEITIAEGATEGTLVVAAAAEAPEADVPQVVVRTTSDFRGEALVDAPVAIKVMK